jgi:hypothetical protein
VLLKCWVAVFVIVLAIAVPAIAHDPAGLRVVGRGVSQSGQKWVQKASASHGQILVETSMPLGDGEDGGGFDSGPLIRQLPLVVGQGSDFGSAHEYEIDGYTYKTVTRLLVDTPHGVLTFRPHRAPRSARKRWPQLRRARFFVRFFASDNKPTTVTALDRHGKVLASEKVG